MIRRIASYTAMAGACAAMCAQAPVTRADTAVGTQMVPAAAGYNTAPRIEGTTSQPTNTDSQPTGTTGPATGPTAGPTTGPRLPQAGGRLGPLTKLTTAGVLLVAAGAGLLYLRRR